MNCPICDSQKNDLLFTLHDDRYGYPGNFPLHQCNQCNHIYINGVFNEKILKDLYTNYYPRSSLSLDDWFPSNAAEGFLSWLNGTKCSAYTWVPENVKILDIGCGFGETLGYHKARGCEVHGVEADENIKRVAEKFGFNVRTGLFNAENYEKNYFDYVTMDQVIEHVIHPLQTLTEIFSVLKPGGQLIISTPNADSYLAKKYKKKWMNWHTPYHLNFFSHESIQIASAKCGYQLKKIVHLTSSEWLLYQKIHNVVYPPHGKPAQFWSPSAEQSVTISKKISFLYRMHKLKINHMITRFLDWRKKGDNILIFLEK